MKDYEFDVFISYASEDKMSVAEPLLKSFQAAGLKVWMDSIEMVIGDDIEQEIKRGLSRSRFGVVIISQIFFAKVWTMKELQAFLERENREEKVLLPVWYGIKEVEIEEFSKALSKRLGANWARGEGVVVGALLRVILSKPVINDKRLGFVCQHRVRQAFAAATCLVAHIIVLSIVILLLTSIELIEFSSLSSDRPWGAPFLVIIMLIVGVLAVPLSMLVYKGVDQEIPVAGLAGIFLAYWLSYFCVEIADFMIPGLVEMAAYSVFLKVPLLIILGLVIAIGPAIAVNRFYAFRAGS